MACTDSENRRRFAKALHDDLDSRGVGPYRHAGHLYGSFVRDERWAALGDAVGFYAVCNWEDNPSTRSTAEQHRPVMQVDKTLVSGLDLEALNLVQEPNSHDETRFVNLVFRGEPDLRSHGYTTGFGDRFARVLAALGGRGR